MRVTSIMTAYLQFRPTGYRGDSAVQIKASLPTHGMWYIYVHGTWYMAIAHGTWHVVQYGSSILYGNMSNMCVQF